jgi:hypothetical protein
MGVQETSAWRRSLSSNIFKRWQLTDVAELVSIWLSMEMRTKNLTSGRKQRELNKKENMNFSQFYQGPLNKGCC